MSYLLKCVCDIMKFCYEYIYIVKIIIIIIITSMQKATDGSIFPAFHYLELWLAWKIKHAKYVNKYINVQSTSMDKMYHNWQGILEIICTNDYRKWQYKWFLKRFWLFCITRQLILDATAQYLYV